MFEDKGPVMYYWLNAGFFETFKLDKISMNIDGKEYDFSQLVVFETKNQTKLTGESEKWYQLGYVLTDSLCSAMKKAESISMTVFKRSPYKRKTWEFKSSIIKEIKATIACFEKYYEPIDAKLVAERKALQEEYERNLKTFTENYRKSTWKDNMSKVQETETTEPSTKTEEALAYKVRLNNDEYLAFFYFNENRLYQGVYTLQEKYVNENNFYNKYKEVKAILESKYGAPLKTIKHRSRDLYDAVGEIGMAIQTGEYVEQTVWETKNTIIQLTIEGENFDSKLTIRYKTKDPELLKQVKKVETIKKSDGF